MPSNHGILCCPVLLLPSIFPNIRVFSNESALRIRWPKYWSFNFNINPTNEYSGLISFRIDWLDLLAVQGTLKSSSPTPQFKSINSLLLSLLYNPILTSIQCLYFLICCLDLVIAFLPRSKHHLTSWLRSPSAMILEPKIQSLTVSLFPHLFAMKWWDQMPWS